MAYEPRSQTDSNADFSKYQWRKFQTALPSLANGIHKFFHLNSSELVSDDPFGATVDYFNQPSNHEKFKGEKDIPEWWAKISLGRRLSDQFGVTLSVPLIIKLNSITRRFHADLDRFARNGDVDKDFAILITDAPNRRAIANDSSRPLIVLEPSRIISGSYSLKEEFVKTLRSANHFSYSKVLKSEDDFYGRESLLEEILDILVHERNNVGLYGLRKSGKSSLLHMTKIRLRKRSVASAVLDLSANISLNSNELRGAIIDKLAEAINSVMNKEPPIELDPRWRAGLTLPDFKFLVRKFLARAAGPCVLLVDETDLCLEPFRDAARTADGTISQKTEDSARRKQRLDVLFELRGLSQELEDELEFLLVFAGVSTALTESALLFGGENYLYKFANPVPIGTMGRDEVARLVRGLGKRSGLLFKDFTTIDQLHSAYGGHPFLTRMACSWIATSDERRAGMEVPFAVSSELARLAISDRSERSAYHELLEVLRSFYGYEPDTVKAIVEWANGKISRLSEEELRLGIRYGILSPEGSLTMSVIKGVESDWVLASRG